MRKIKHAYFLLLVPLLFAFAYQAKFSSNTIHIGVVVSDLEKSVQFYKTIVGMVQVDQTSFDVNGDFAKRSGLSNGTPFHVEVLKLGSGKESTQLKLMSFGRKAKKKTNNYIYDYTGMRYVTIFVEDMTPVIKRLKDKGIEFLGETPTPLNNGNQFVLIKDPDGIFIELIGPAKN